MQYSQQVFYAFEQSCRMLKLYPNRIGLRIALVIVGMLYAKAYFLVEGYTKRLFATRGIEIKAMRRANSALQCLAAGKCKSCGCTTPELFYSSRGCDYIEPCFGPTSRLGVWYSKAPDLLAGLLMLANSRAEATLVTAPGISEVPFELTSSVSDLKPGDELALEISCGKTILLTVVASKEQTDA